MAATGCNLHLVASPSPQYTRYGLPQARVAKFCPWSQPTSCSVLAAKGKRGSVPGCRDSSVSRSRPCPVGASQRQKSRPSTLRATSPTVSEETADQTAASEEEDGEQEGGAAEKEAETSSEIASRLIAAVERGDRGAVDEARRELAGLQQERDALAPEAARLAGEVAAAKDRFLRLNADFDNFRKRSEREKLDLAARVKGDVVEELLPMVDNFERAKGSIRAETDGERRIDGSYQGIYKQFVEAMRGLGVSAVETVGKEFDPNVHEAIMREDSAEYPEGVVTQEFRRGFVLGEKLLRAAMVKVSAGPGPDGAGSAPDSTEGSFEDVATPQEVESTT